MKSLHRLTSLFVGVFLLALSLSGCVPLVVGAAAGVGGYAWVNGELAKEYQVSADKLQKAAIRGMKDMNLVISEQTGDRLTAKIVGKFADSKKVEILIEAMTEKSAKLKVRVGMFGDQTRSELVVNAIEKHL